ncbi:SIP domain-containing protein [Brevibacterium marinum]|uniref:NADPH-dependent ferric siderophore reductase n=1 Tax=Brevibacterium marinum TaxID=418643 RepID=A0A846RQ64_9MICO|nr:NADPH-dependent ferric siderophore reductase [Brevibacterium marinum]
MGDRTPRPEVNSWLEAIPAEVAVTVALEDDRDRGTVKALPRTEHLRALDLDSDGLYLWAAGEGGLIRQVRSVNKHDLELKKDHHYSQFYWFEGKPTG